MSTWLLLNLQLIFLMFNIHINDKNDVGPIQKKALKDKCSKLVQIKTTSKKWRIWRNSGTLYLLTLFWEILSHTHTQTQTNSWSLINRDFFPPSQSTTLMTYSRSFRILWLRSGTWERMEIYNTKQGRILCVPEVKWIGFFGWWG